MGKWRERGSNRKRLRGVWGRRWGGGSDGEVEGVEKEGAQKGMGLERETVGVRGNRPGGGGGGWGESGGPYYETGGGGRRGGG
jgi:hypothetical protein